MEKYLLLLSFITAVYSQSFTPGSLDTFMLNEHNRFRRMENAANMKKMVWSDKLARVAQSWADTCKQHHQNIGYGENLYMHTRSKYAVKDLVIKALNAWYDEKDLWRWGDGWSMATGHYTQLVWAKTDKVGCGIRTDCPAQGSLSRTYMYIACFYDPAGNSGSENPYIRGTPCSSCPGQCDQGLCTGTTTEGGGSNNNNDGNTWDNNNNGGNTWDNNNNDGNTWDNNNNDGNTWDNNNDNWWDNNNNDGNTWDNNNNDGNTWDNNNNDGNTWNNNNNDGNTWDNNNDDWWDNSNNDDWWDNNNNDGNTWDNNNNNDWNSWDNNNDDWDSWDNNNNNWDTNNWWKRGKIVRRQPASLGSHGNMKTNTGKHIVQLPVEMKRKAILRKLENVKKDRKNQLLARKLVAALKSLSKNEQMKIM